MIISRQAVRYIITNNKTVESSIECSSEHYPLDVLIKVDADNIVVAKYDKDNILTLPDNTFKDKENQYVADIRINSETGQKYLRTPYDFYEIWQANFAEKINLGKENDIEEEACDNGFTLVNMKEPAPENSCIIS